MGTKNNPGKFDCYSHAEPDEPMFILLGRDPVASIVVDYWVFLREIHGKMEPEKLREARDCSRSMEQWAKIKGKGDQIKEIQELVPNRVQAILEENARLREENDRLKEENRMLRSYTMSDSVKCDQCGCEGRRKSFQICPDDWFYNEVTVDDEIIVVATCSLYCALTFWKKGPGVLPVRGHKSANHV